MPAGPPICNNAFIRATESPSGSMAVLGGAGLAPGEGCSPSAPTLTCFLAYLSQAEIASALRGPCCTPTASLTLCHPGCPRGGRSEVHAGDGGGRRAAGAGTFPCVLSVQAAPVPASLSCICAAGWDTDTCACHSRELPVSLPVSPFTAVRPEAGPWGLPPLQWGPRGQPARVAW